MDLKEKHNMDLKEKHNFGLIIQGPLFSRGRTGKDAHISFDKLGESCLVDFDCRENITRLVEDYGSIFSEIVLSTWDSELKPEDQFPGIKVVGAPDPGGIEDKEKKNYKYKDNNKYRQFTGMKNGLDAMSNVDYVVKVRTDQYLDLEKLVQTFLSGLNKVKNKEEAIFVPVIHRATYLLHDLYFASSFKALNDFCDAVLSFDKFEFIHSVHREMPLKHAFCKYRDNIGVSNCFYFPVWPPLGVSKETRKIFNYMFDNIYFSLGKEVFGTIVWRGGLVSKEYVDNHFVLQTKKQSKINISHLASIDWERFYVFSRDFQGVPVTKFNNIKIHTGKLMWRALGMVRQFKNFFR